MGFFLEVSRRKIMDLLRKYLVMSKVRAYLTRVVSFSKVATRLPGTIMKRFSWIAKWEGGFSILKYLVVNLMLFFRSVEVLHFGHS